MCFSLVAYGLMFKTNFVWSLKSWIFGKSISLWLLNTNCFKRIVLEGYFYPKKKEINK